MQRRRSQRVEKPYIWPNDQFGPWPLPTIENARAIVGSVVVHTSINDLEKLAQWIAATGDCVWHACYEVFRPTTPVCYCVPCVRVRQSEARA